MSEIIEITKALVDFRDKRDWKQFHDTKNLSSALSIEVNQIGKCIIPNKWIVQVTFFAKNISFDM